MDKEKQANFVKSLRDEAEQLQLYAAVNDTRGAFKFVDIFKVCDYVESLKAINNRLKILVPFARHRHNCSTVIDLSAEDCDCGYYKAFFINALEEEDKNGKRKTNRSVVGRIKNI